MEKKVLLTEPIHNEAVKKLIKHKIKVILYSKKNITTDIMDVDAIIVRIKTIDKELLLKSKKLKIIVRHGTGVDNIDVALATQMGIVVARVPDVNTISVAEYTITMIGVLLKQLFLYYKNIKEGKYISRENWINRCAGVDLKEKKLGIIGLGRIGKLVAEKAFFAFDMKVFGYDPYIKINQELYPYINQVKNLKELLRNSDIISLHIPLTSETHNLIGKHEISWMKKGAYLINASRGGIVDENALVSSIKNEYLGGATIDVFKEEPVPKENPLLNLDNVIVTPHIAGVTKDSFFRISIESVNCIISFFEGKPLKNMIIN